MKTSREEIEIMGFWENETCDYCGGAIVERHVTVHRVYKGKHILVENVPVGVCTECSMRYYAANVLKSIAERVRGRTRAKRNVSVPVYAL
jgi:YgiT-type zinc finger domain-containing protein